jgi:hypothetical protein
MKQRTDIFLINCEDIKSNTEIPAYVDDKTLNQSIIFSQNAILQDMIGETLLQSLYTQVEDNYNSGTTITYSDLLFDYIYPVLINESIYNSLENMAIRIDNQTISQHNDARIHNTAELKYSIETKKNYYQKQSQFYQKTLKMYLSQNYNVYTELHNIPAYSIPADLGQTNSQNQGIIFRKRRY